MSVGLSSDFAEANSVVLRNPSDSAASNGKVLNLACPGS